MLKKGLLLTVAFAIALATVPMFAAFEAHVINVTARIENALSVDTTPVDFGTVFPQEELDQRIDINLSQSFINEGNADDVEYIIRQKPKCAITTDNGKSFDPRSTASGHVLPNGEIICDEVPPRELVTDEVWGPLPLLCRYLSKHDLDPEDQNDDPGLDAFHEIGQVVEQSWVWNDVHGRLAKSEGDTHDGWNLDLKVPCFGDHCAQDWETFVTNINPDAIPGDFIQPIENEHKIFGCDIWIEVTGVSRLGIYNSSLTLENKDEQDNWLVTEDNTKGKLLYKESGSTFDYELSAQGLKANTSYSLIVYDDPWPGNNPGALIGTFVTDGSGEIVPTAGSIDLSRDLVNDKIWLVPSSDYNAGTNSMQSWNPLDYLYEYNLISYDDTDV